MGSMALRALTDLSGALEEGNKGGFHGFRQSTDGNGGYQEYHFEGGDMDDLFGDLFGNMFGGKGERKNPTVPADFTRYLRVIKAAGEGM